MERVATAVILIKKRNIINPNTICRTRLEHKWDTEGRGVSGFFFVGLLMEDAALCYHEKADWNAIMKWFFLAVGEIRSERDYKAKKYQKI